MKYRIIGSSFIQSTFHRPKGPPNPQRNPNPQGRFDAVIYFEEESKLVHCWRESDVHEGWKFGRVISDRATGPGAIIQSRSKNFLVMVPEANEQRLAYYIQDNSGFDAETWCDTRWHLKGKIRSAASGPASMVVNRINDNLEVVMLEGNQLNHYWSENGIAWKGPYRITDRATAPACLIQSSYTDNLELVVPEGSHLSFYWRDSRDLQWKPKKGQRILRYASGPAGFVQGPFGVGVHKNFEVLVPRGDILSHYWRDNADPGLPWKGGGRVTSRGGVISAVALAHSTLDGHLEALVQEENGSLFHYFRYELRPGQWVWYRGSCLMVDEGSITNKSAYPQSEKVCQLTGERDKQRARNTINQTESRFGIRGTDLGASFRHGNRTYFLFGDTHWSSDYFRKLGYRWDEGQSVPESLPQATHDTIAYTIDTDADKGLELTFHRSYLRVANLPDPGHVAGDRYGQLHMGALTFAELEQRKRNQRTRLFVQGEYDVPLDGFSFDDQMFVFFSTNHFEKWRKTMGRSILTYCKEAHPDFEASRPDRPLEFIYLAEFSRWKFVNVSVALVNERDIRTYGLPAARRGLLIWGTGAYRADNVYLAFMPLDDWATREKLRNQHKKLSAPPAVWYYTGEKQGQAGRAGWSRRERDAVPLFYPAAIGELSVRWNRHIGLWVMMYCAGPNDPMKEGNVCMRVS